MVSPRLSFVNVTKLFRANVCVAPRTAMAQICGRVKNDARKPAGAFGQLPAPAAGQENTAAAL
jgi:hypothetical protein